MACSSGTSSTTSSQLAATAAGSNSGSDSSELQALMHERKRKRMVSNRESARRSRERKQKHLDDLTAQVAQLTEENGQILTSINITTQHFLSLEADNSILRAQVGELSNRLDSLNDILQFLTTTATPSPTTTADGGYFGFEYEAPAAAAVMAEQQHCCFMNNMGFLNHQPLMASAAANDVFLVN
ncbi:unnamed protein product [Linum trigynum]|uniref:BZIP domain-containing protein n=1 Tax=Linum trigynum TaxID=586398 RepID=A0AAV2CAL8_9ROSI